MKLEKTNENRISSIMEKEKLAGASCMFMV